MKRKMILLLCALTACFCTAFSLVACGEDPNAADGECSHRYSEWTVLYRATCIADGQKIRSCEKCYAFQTEVIPQTNTHTMGGEWQYNQECHFYDCVDCGMQFTQTHSIQNDACTVCGVDFSVGELSYELSSDGTYYWVSGIGTYKESHLVIPTEYNGKPVKAIKSQAFSWCSLIESVVIGEHIEIVKDFCFYNNQNLQSVETNIISASLFDKCTSLTTIRFGKNLKSLSSFYFSFEGCNNISTIEVHPENQNYYSVGNCVIEKSSGKFVMGGKNCKLPTDGSIQSIGERAYFYQDSAIISIPNGVQNIEAHAFAYCENITGLVIPKSVSSIGNNVFLWGDGLTKVYYGGTSTQWDNIIIGSSNSELTSATLYYYSETQPTEEGNYWHYGTDGLTPVEW